MSRIINRTGPDNPPPSHSDQHAAAWRISLIYAVFASVWVLLSSSLLAVSVEDPVLQARIELFKGMGFVAATGGLLYLLLRSRRQWVPALARPPEEQDAGRRDRWLLVVAVLMIVPLLALTILKIHRPQVEASARDNLVTISGLKAQNVAQWLSERLGNVRTFEHNEGFNERVRLLAEDGDPVQSRLINARLQALETSHHFLGATLLDTNGATLLTRGPVDSSQSELGQQALEQQATVFSPLRSDEAGAVYLDVAAPLFLPGNAETRLVGAVVLRQYLDSAFTQLVLEWPSASGTGANALALRNPDGDGMIALGIDDGRATLTPLPEDVAAVLPQTLGTTFRHTGADGRSALVIAKPVEGTDWLLLSRLGHDEIMRPVYQLIFWISLVAGAAVLVSGSAALLLLRQRRRSEQLQTALEKRDADQLIERFFNLPFAGMAIAGLDGRWLKFNDRFCAMLGYSREEMLHTPPRSITHPEDLETYIRRHERLARGEIDLFNGEIRFIRKDGAIVVARIEASRHQPQTAPEPMLYVMVQDITEETHLRATLERSLRFLRGVANRVPGMIYQFRLNPDGSSCFPFASKAIEDVYGLTPESVLHDASEVFERIDPEDRDGVQASIRQSARTLTLWRHEYRARLPGRGEVWLKGSAQPVREQGGATLWYGFIQDITDQKRIEQDQRIAATAFEGHHAAMFVTDPGGRLIRINQAFTRITGYSPADTEGHTPALLKSGRQEDAFYQAFWQALLHDHYWEGEIWNRRKNGEIYPEWLSVSAVLDQQGEVINYVGAFSDITSAKEAQRQIQWLSNFDGLTDLPNASLLRDRVEQALIQARDHDDTVALIKVDLDQFKTINDSLSHKLGDELLVQIAHRLRQVAGTSDTVSRQSGDEFTLLLPNRDQREVVTLVDRVQRSISEPQVIGDQELVMTASVGIALFPADGDDFDSLNKAAEVAMFRAKQYGRNCYAFYEATMEGEALRTLQLGTALHRAMDDNQFQLYYQPQLDLVSGRLVGAEALLRWHHPEYGWVSPAEFIPLAESNGLIVPIGEWTLQTAIRDMKHWIGCGLDRLSVAVNLSPLQFRQPNLVERIESILTQEALPTRHLELELTESAAMDNPERAVQVIQALNNLGVSLSIDDFGTGYSSMNYLKSFAVDKLKIDRSFIDGIDTHSENQAIVLAVIRMAQALGIQVLAEGVERAEEQAFLADNGCALIQGYLYARPMPAEDFIDFALEARGS